MSPDELSGPDLDGVVADANAVGLPYVVIGGFKRLAGRPRDRNDLEELEAFHGELPIDPIPGIDT